MHINNQRRKEENGRIVFDYLKCREQPLTIRPTATGNTILILRPAIQESNHIAEAMNHISFLILNGFLVVPSPPAKADLLLQRKLQNKVVPYEILYLVSQHLNVWD